MGSHLDDSTAIMRASIEGHVEIVRLLLQAAADINLGNEGCTAFDLANQNGHIEIARLLSEAGAVPSRGCS